MLKIPNLYGFTGESYDFLYNFINEALKEGVLKLIEDITDDGDGWFYFPESFPEEDELKIDILKALYSLLNAEKAYVPTLIMEYLLDQVLSREIDFFKDGLYIEWKSLSGYKKYIANECFGGEKEYHEEQRDKRVNYPFSDKTQKMLIQNYMDVYKELFEYGDYEEELTDNELKKEATEVVNTFWHYSEEWWEIIFWDADYEMLDRMSAGELRGSYINKYVHIMSENASDEEYFVPEDWLHSKDFHFLNESKR